MFKGEEEIRQLKEHPRDVNITIGEHLQLKCESDDRNKSQITWYHNNNLIDGLRNKLLTIQDNHTLRSQSSNKPNHYKQLSGVYYCIATNPETKSIFVSRNATVKFISQKILEPPRSTDVSLGWTVMLNCRPQQVDATITWMKDDVKLNESNKILLFRNGSIIIKDIRKDDIGTYSCVININNAQKITFESKLILKEGPKILLGPDSLQLKQGSDARFSCQVIGDPEPVIEWSKVPGIMPKTRLSILEDKSLVLKQLKPSDEGIYTCKASNQFGVAMAEANLTVFS
ncbi:hypothetical protein HELRODRAFT_65392 [Helobdella robusta]|uniref:Ig-like domain-containing protein n=1 Tax=Helobdella robusta TaxID=6412 RepID=T1FY71_HELRO|nr:hypothetical protein HELRODRAFT_65392 [Helobdella robusta]ESO02132.1 hypothetical protein HELRODRAFT_65392 [Helobdella robusta]